MKRRKFLEKLGLGALAAPLLARVEVSAQEPEPTPKYADGMLGRLQQARDEYEVERGVAPDYFNCSQRTRNVLVEELEGMRRYDAPPEGYLPLVTPLEVDGMRWMRADPTLPYGVFVVGDEDDLYWRDGWDDHERHMREYMRLAARRPGKTQTILTGITSG